MTAVFASCIKCVTHCINQIDYPEIYLDGAINMLNHPEFSDVVRARNF